VGAIAPPRAFRPGRWLFLLGALVLAGAVGVYLPWSRGTFERGRSEGRKMLAVLPFENLTGDPAEDYFSDGFTEEMISRLGNLEPDRLGVIARTSVMHYKQAHAPLDRLGRELGVEYVLEGSIRRDHERVRITAQLIQIEDQTHLWSRQYDRDRTDVLRVQSEIAQAIADQIEDTLGGSATRPALPTALSPRTYEGYDQYLRGLYHWNKRTPEDLRLAIESFQRAVAINPEDARSYAALASTHALMGSYSYVPQSEAFQTAREAALQAIELDSRLAAAHTSLALINEFADFDWRTAEERFRRAIALDANYPTAHHWYAEYLAHQGRFDEAASEIELARRLDPRSLIIAADRGAILYFARQFAPAIEQFRSVLAVEPGFGRAHMIIFAYAQQGHLTEALEQIQEWRKFEDGPWLGAGSAYLHGRLGRMAEAREALREMEESNRRWHQDILTMRATAYIGMGLENEALDCLQKLCEKRSAYLVFLKVDPLYDPLRDDPRFPDLLRCANLAL
jgi:TolB-like protein/Tfp pilus assembly protein PilF